MSTEEKQNFLREKILEKGYDVNEFVEFLSKIKTILLTFHPINISLRTCY